MEAMLCKKLKELKPEYFVKRKIKEVIVQPKLNGIRAIYDPEKNILLTRNNHIITSCPHIEKACKNVGIPLDGEIYTTNPLIDFNTLNGAVRRLEPTDASLKLQYHVFDTLEGIQKERARLLKELEKKVNHDAITFVPSGYTSVHDLPRWYFLFLTWDYEGMVIRNPNAFYTPGRHVGTIWKIKPIYETEGTFMQFIPSTTSLHKDTFGSLLLQADNGRLYACSGFTEETRKLLYRELRMGMKVTVKYGAMSTNDPKTQVPLFPRFKAVRWDK